MAQSLIKRYQNISISISLITKLFYVSNWLGKPKMKKSHMCRKMIGKLNSEKLKQTSQRQYQHQHFLSSTSNQMDLNIGQRWFPIKRNHNTGSSEIYPQLIRAQPHDVLNSKHLSWRRENEASKLACDAFPWQKTSTDCEQRQQRQPRQISEINSSRGKKSSGAASPSIISSPSAVLSFPRCLPLPHFLRARARTSLTLRVKMWDRPAPTSVTFACPPSFPPCVPFTSSSLLFSFTREALPQQTPDARASPVQPSCCRRWENYSGSPDWSTCTTADCEGSL